MGNGLRLVLPATNTPLDANSTQPFQATDNTAVNLQDGFDNTYQYWLAWRPLSAPELLNRQIQHPLQRQFGLRSRNVVN